MPGKTVIGPTHHAGHLFVVHGKIHTVVHDAAIVPVDRHLHFTSSWQALFPEWPSAPDGWERGWGRVAESSYWLVEVGDGDYGKVLERLGAALTDAVQELRRRQTSDSEGAGAEQSSLDPPLVAVPVLGIGEGGHRHEQGQVLRELVVQLSELATELAAHIVLVTPDPAVYSAAQYLRRPSAKLDEAKGIGELAAAGRLALFIGAGASVPAGLPTWNQLVHGLASGIDVDDKVLDALGPVDQAELIHNHAPDGFGQAVAEMTAKAPRPSLVHALLAGLHVREVVTTNYDLLYEQAVQGTDESIESVMPWSPLGQADRWVLKLHGDVNHQDKIVLTRRHMVRYDAANRPSASMLQSLFLTRHVLFVGVSFTDDNVIRLAHEVDAYRETYQDPPPHELSGHPEPPEPYATVLDANDVPDRARKQLWKDKLDWLPVRELTNCNSFRALEVFLDEVGIFASTDSSWLLDPRFAGLLDEDERELALELRRLGTRVPTDGAWEPLLSALKAMGYGSKR